MRKKNSPKVLVEDLNKSESDELEPLQKALIAVTNGKKTVERASFVEDPAQNRVTSGVYKQKTGLLPDTLLKRIAIEDDLVAAVARARQQHISSFGRPRPDRFSKGYLLKVKTGVLDNMSDPQKAELDQQIEDAINLLWTCGRTDIVDREDRCSFAEWLSLSARNAVVLGRIATEIVYTDQGRFGYFRAVDAGTVYKAAEDSEAAAQAVRDRALQKLRQISNKKITEVVDDNTPKGPYTWIQVVAGQPQQAYRSHEMRCYNFYPVPDIELDGYPVTPLDTTMNAVTTHLNITTHNKLYFQNGRASKGMVIIKSDDVSPTMVKNMKQQMNASINSVNNAWRMPVVTCGTEEEIAWQTMDAGGRDAEFQYLQDSVARVILSAFMMSPEELPGWAYLSKGTNSQSLSESNSEYQLTAARDLGLRPLISSFEDFVNSDILPLIAPAIADKIEFRIFGLDSETPEKESIRLQQDAELHCTFDDILEKVEKSPIGQKYAATIPLNSTYKSYLDQYFTVGEILEHFCGREGAAKDPSLAYRRDEYFFKWTEMQQMQQQAQQQAQAQQQQGGQQQPPPGGGGGGGGQQEQSSDDAQKDQPQGPDNGPVMTDNQKDDSIGELARSIDIAHDSMVKSEKELPPSKKLLLAQHRKTVDFFLEGFLHDAREATHEIVGIAKKHRKGS